MPRFIFQPNWRAVGAAAIVLGFHTHAAAEDDELVAPPADKIRLEYRAPAECPDTETFKTLVGSRVAAGWEAAPEELARRVDVTVSGTQGSYVATIEFVDERGERVARAVRGEHCDNVVDGIAFVTALAIQSRVQEALDRSEPADAPAPAPVSAPITSVAAPHAAAREPPLAATQPALPAARDEPSSAGLRISAHAALTTAIGPSVAPGAGLGIVFERRSVRLGVRLQGFWTGRVETRGVPARFELFTTRLEGCPLPWVMTSWASLELCPFAELGTVTGEALEDPPEVVRGRRGSAFWFSLGGAGRLVGRFGILALELEALLGAPLVREEFYVEGGDVLYRVPAIYGSAGVGVGVGF